ncbi:MAG: hypothetical protein D6692_08035 [Planctomycetota bacterium]|nr:MAG: hypothetical protein D6692_08035 [Planctomycetota bacterium]
MHRLATLLVLFLACTHAPAQTDRQLVDRFDRAEANQQYDRALEAALAITERYPDSATWAFNAGRMHARLDQPDDAIAQLRRAADLGYTGINSFEQHADLNPLRDRDDFKAILEQIRANARKRFDAFKAEALKHDPPTFIPQSGADGTKPAVVIALHGTGGRGQPMLDALRAACEQLGAICIAPDALRPVSNGPDAGFAWTYRDESEWFVTHLIDKAVKDHNADPDRVILLGFSQGANIALVMARTHADRLPAVIPICGHYEPALTDTPAATAPMYLLTGSRDNWKQTYLKARDDLKASDTPHQLRIVPGMGHQMPNPTELRKALEWALTPDK